MKYLRILPWLIGAIAIACFLSIWSLQPPQHFVAQEPAALNPKSGPAPAVVQAFENGGCGGCHRIPGVPGADGEVGPDLSMLGEAAGGRRPGYSAKKYIRESIVDPDAFIAPEGTEETFPAGVMLQSFAESLSDEELQQMVDYLATLRGARDLPQPSPGIPLSRALPPESQPEPFEKYPGKPAASAKIALGRHLFFDRRLSANNSRSCADCHQPDKAFADGLPVSPGYPSTKLFRNTPSLINVAYQPAYFWDGRIGDLPSVVRDHLTEAHFMAIDGRLLVERLRQAPAYEELFGEVYGAGPSFGKVLDAVTAYLTSLNSPPSAYDRMLAGDKNALSPAAQAGWELFRGKARCAECHQGSLFTDHAFHRIDPPELPQLWEDPERQVTFRRFYRVLGMPNYRNLRRDPGRRAVTLQPNDEAKFRTPSLREVARTAPYMHNGSLATLEEVVRFYNQGGGKQQTADLQPLGLTAPEQAQLVAFLESLSSPAIKIEAPDSPRYAVLRLGDGKPRAGAAPIPQQRTPRVARDFPPLASLPDPPAPADNPITPAKVELGKLLFFDPRMSADASTSCHSCHAMRTGGSLATPISMGGPGTSHWRNSQTILNVAYYNKFNWDGAQGSIESQNAGAWTGAVAGNLDPSLGEERLAQIPEYVTRFRQVFGGERPLWDDALRAVATFQRTLVSRKTPLDRYLAGDAEAISAAAVRGYDLFRGKANCISCHHGPLASDDSYHALGVPQLADFEQSPLKQITFRYELVSKGAPLEVYRSATSDDGLYFVTKRAADRGKFRTPSLRGLTHTAPYMHNGVFATLAEVVAFYNDGGGDHPNKSPLLAPLQLSSAEQDDLVAFLQTLSGEPLQVTRPELPPYGRFDFFPTAR